MKNFLELLATDLHLDIVINGKNLTAGLQDSLTFNVDDIVTIDGIEILPKYKHLIDTEVLTIPGPFYCWYHEISGQGWLLIPQ